MKRSSQEWIALSENVIKDPEQIFSLKISKNKEVQGFQKVINGKEFMVWISFASFNALTKKSPKIDDHILDTNQLIGETT